MLSGGKVGDDDERYTPKRFIESARVVFGGRIDTDPASSDIANFIVQASTYYTIHNNGLNYPWYGNTWLNPPYSRIAGTNRSHQQMFTKKLADEYHKGNVTAAIALLFGNAIYTEYYDPLREFPVCLHRKGVTFLTPKFMDRDDTRNGFGTVFVYLGSEYLRFRKEFKKYGQIYIPD